MGDSQSSSKNKSEPSSDDKQSIPETGTPRKEDYYYDDSTGYEIYDEETETEEQDVCTANPPR